MDLLIRSYRPEDKERLLAIFLKNTPRYFGTNELADFEIYLEKNSATYLIVVLNNIIAGGAGYYINKEDHSGRITWIFFDPAHSGKGLGRQVVEYCLNLLSLDERVEKYVVTTSQLSYGFFEKFGFELVRIEQDFWATGLHLYEMVKQKA